MSDQYVFELQFKVKADGSDFRENQFVIIDGSSMADFSRLKEDLGLCMPEPFTVQYIDDEEDVISIDTEEEFQEFAKIAKKRSSRGMLMRLILNSTLPLDHVTSPPRGSNEMKQSSMPAEHDIKQQSSRYQQFKEVLKKELKNEILSELKEMGNANQARIATANDSASEPVAGASKQVERMEEEAKEVEYEEDSDNLYVLHLPEANSRKTKLMHHQKKLEKKEKIVELKIDQRLEKLEMKRKKLMEKFHHIAHYKAMRKLPADLKVPSLPIIISATVTKESSELTKPVAAGKMFTHFWTVVNDGTVPLNNVELRHTWSTPGLEPLEQVLKVVPLPPGQQCKLGIRFRAPNCFDNSSSIHLPTTFFTSYWHFYRLVGPHWQEFSHYVSVTGNTKPLKLSLQEFRESEKTESNKKAKHEEKRVVSFMEAVGAVSAVAESPKTEQEKKVVNEESVSNITLKKQMEQLEATLASSEIAAEMAREAARLLAMAAAAEGNTAPAHTARKPSEGDKLNECSLEEAAAGVQLLNLVDSESDTDTNMETNEDSDRGFVIVNMTTDHTGKNVTKEGDKAITQMEDDMKEEAQSQPDPLLLPRLDPNAPYPVFPPPPPRANPTMFVPLPQNVYNYPVFTPTQNSSSHGIVFPPPVNYSQIPTYPPIPNFHHTHPPPVPIPLSQPPFIPVLQNQNMPPFERPGIEKMFWSEAAANQVKSTQKLAENEQHQGNNSGTEITANTINVERPQQEPPKQQMQQEPQQQQLQQQPQQQLQQEQPQQQLQQQPQQQPQQQLQEQTETSPQSNKQKKESDHVEILPQALVNGAINVAATAYSTAWNALNNLRPKEGEAIEFDPVFENNMATLVEMGFHNLERNARLLKRFNNDISQVIGVICSTGGGHDLDID